MCKDHNNTLSKEEEATSDEEEQKSSTISAVWTPSSDGDLTGKDGLGNRRIPKCSAIFVTLLWSHLNIEQNKQPG